MACGRCNYYFEKNAFMKSKGGSIYKIILFLWCQLEGESDIKIIHLHILYIILVVILLILDIKDVSRSSGLQFWWNLLLNKLIHFYLFSKNKEP